MTSEMQPGRETKVNERDKEISAPLLALFTRTDHLTIGRVCGSEDHGVWRISALPGDTVLARVAVSCLVKPQLDDLVQLYQTARGCWVLAILERSGDAEAVVLDFGAASLRIQAHACSCKPVTDWISRRFRSRAGRMWLQRWRQSVTPMSVGPTPLVPETRSSIRRGIWGCMHKALWCRPKR